MIIEPKRGEIWWAHMGGNQGSEQGGLRPVLIIQNDTGNRYSPTVIIATISHAKRKDLPIHVRVDRSYKMPKESVIMLEQLRTIDKSRLRNCSTQLTNEHMGEVDQALIVSLGLPL
ncbi:type II toxin-antitoxin system PemK/MazF family toxin [Paenibacillus sp. S150]|uniref:type II toxin-antitoxin system PemK/MazF family toxin n=1 Tax=Paenibacillus sp. S150 TaxID=2749826 RepID=UPI001C575F13|nr:type II toxin-antitoxin system PemK/MazF family toxin [Paenibacillus sp. S150]MBW4083575.1 type II toxin-antitoxin system PemK/MazF family toxin [Paenibacillus sp. S150]